MKVLVVDDDATIRGLLRTLLAREGVASAVAEDGVEALTLCERETFEVAISDLDMPRMNGMELGRYLRERYPAMALLAFTGSSGGGLLRETEGVFDRVFEKIAAVAVVAEAARLARGGGTRRQRRACALVAPAD